MIQRALAGEANSPIYFALIPEGGSDLIATVGFHTISALNASAEITYDVAPSHWGRGIASLACKHATEWALVEKGWLRVQATTLCSNVRSQRVLQGCGFEREGLLRNFRIVRGRPADYWMFSAIPAPLQEARDQRMPPGAMQDRDSAHHLA